MPGLFGGLGAPAEQYDVLQKEFACIWRDCRSVRFEDTILGSHALREPGGLHQNSETVFLAVDGEASIYAAARNSVSSRQNPLFSFEGNILRLDDRCAGNVAVIDVAQRRCYLACEWTGSFPLYYSWQEGSLLFSSHLRPLARALGSSPDPAGILGFLVNMWQMGGRTLFQGVRRLQPGQALYVDGGSRNLTLIENSRAWTDSADATTMVGVEEVAEQVWDELRTAAPGNFSLGDRHALMLSGGWDSRTLLALLLEHLGPHQLMAYVHGDTRSREVNLVRRITAAKDIPCRIEPLADRVYELDFLQASFARVENILYPYWHLAGQLLRRDGIDCVSAGVYGEVLGGHYSHVALERGTRKLRPAVRVLWEREGTARPLHLDDQLNLIRKCCRTTRRAVPWYASQALHDWAPTAFDALECDLETAYKRLERRGIASGPAMIEAFISEHRGTQLINAQTLSLRADVDVALPYCNRGMLLLASRIPLWMRLHNEMNRVVLTKKAGDLLRFPTAATLVPATAPLWLQEGSRFARRVGERARWKLHRATRGVVDRPRNGWVNFDFLRHSGALLELVADLRSPLWNARRMRERIRGVASGEDNASPQAIAEALLTAYTVDLMMR